MHTKSVKRSQLSWFYMMLASTMMVGSAYGQAAVSPEVQQELRYIQALTDARMPDYAEIVLNKLTAEYPEVKPLVKAYQLQLILQVGKFDEAKAVIAREANQESPEAWAMKLTLADYYYAYGKYPEALGIYKSMFDKYKAAPPETIKKLYSDSYYKYAQMQLFLDQEKEALVAYEDLLKLPLESGMKRQVQFEAAQLMVKLAEATPKKEQKPLLEKAQKATEALLWSQDLWFGRGIVLLAHINVLREDISGAQKLMKQYMPQLKNLEAQINDQARETGEDLSRLSPIAEARYLMGLMMQNEAEKILDSDTPDAAKAKSLLVSALSDMVNVYIKYPSASYAPDALNRSEAIKSLLIERCGVKEIKVNVTDEQRREISEKQFANARMYFNQSQFEKAIEGYDSVLNQFPESVPDSISALSEYARAYVQFADTQKAEDKQYMEMCADAIIGHLAERFCEKEGIAMTSAGDELRRIAEFYVERGQTAQSEATYKYFFELYPEHTLAAPVLMSSAEKLYKAEDYAGAEPRYKTLMDFYQKSPLSFTAMNRLADCYSKMGSVTNELAVRKEYVKRVSEREEPGQDLITGMYQVARINREQSLAALKAANANFDAIRRAPAAAAPEAPAEGEVAPADPLAEATKAIKVANQGLIACVNEYGSIIKLLDAKTRAKYEENADQIKRNDSILQGTLFERSYTLTLITQPAAQLPKLKTMAIQGYEALLKQYPETEMAPSVLMQLGTLWSTMKSDDPAVVDQNMKKADTYFTQLSEKYPESKQAKNAYFMRGRTLIELGFRREGVEILKKMFNESGKYSAGQMFSAAEELLESKEYELARQGYTLAMEMAKDNPAIIVPSQIGMAKILMAEEKYVESADALDKFIEANPKSYKLLEANMMLSEAAAEAAFGEEDRAERVKLFNRAVKAIRAVKPYKKGAKDLAEIEMEVGRILETKAEVEEKYKNEDLVDRYVGEAASHYQAFLMSVDRNNADLFPSIETAYLHSAKLMLQMEKYADGTPVYADVKMDCETYLEMFPTGKYQTQMRNFLTEANISDSTSN